MADLSQIKLADNTTYNLKDSEARTSISDMTARLLPTVSASDNGKVLRVVSGEWAAATIPDANGVSF